MKLKMTNEAKTGILVIICLAVLGALILKVGNFKLLQEGYIVKAQFRYTAGVQKHAPVRLSGVDVGEVKDIRILYGDDTLIELDIWLNEGVKLRSDSTAYVTTLGLMGEKYIEVKAGSNTSEYAKPGDQISTEEPLRLEELIEIGKKVAEDIGKLTRDVNAVISDNRPKIDQIFTNLEETSYNFNDFSQDIRFHPWKILAKGKEKSRAEIDKEMEKIRREREEKRPKAAVEKAS